MHKTTTLILIIILFNFSFSQEISEAQLPEPGKLSLNYLNSLGPKNILYGAIPKNSNGEVLIFNHGFIASSESMLIGNTFYEEAYNAGYRTAFVSTTRGEGMWENGKLLAQSITQIHNKYQTKAYLIAHSNGGKASEVALFEYEKSNLIKRVITLGTPFYGTPLADLSQLWWFKWVWSAVGLQGGTSTSTTYYCSDVVRPYFDDHPNNEPEKFANLGTWGWNDGNTIFSPSMILGGGLIYANGGGMNDGVTPYSSSYRPGATKLLEYDGSSKGELDHLDVTYGQYVWDDFVLPNLNENYNYNLRKDTNTFTNTTRVSSNYQIVSSENNYETITLDKGNKSGRLQIYHKEKNASFLSKDVRLLPTQKRSTQSNRSSYISNFTVERKKQNRDIPLSSTSEYAAFLFQGNGIVAHLDKLKNKLIVSIDGIDENINAKTVVNAVIAKTIDLDGKKIEDTEKVYSFKLNKKGKFILNTKKFDDGVYSIFITIDNENNFKRSIVSGFIKGALEFNPTELTTVSPPKNKVSIYPNPISRDSNLKIDNFQGTANVTIYTITGNIKVSKKITFENKIPIHSLTENLEKGIYLMRIRGEKIDKTVKFLK